MPCRIGCGLHRDPVGCGFRGSRERREGQGIDPDVERVAGWRSQTGGLLCDRGEEAELVQCWGTHRVDETTNVVDGLLGLAA